MDTTADACEDFYQYACGGWQKNNPIPDDQASWSVYGKLYDDNQRYLWGILSDLAASKNGTPDQRKLGDYFAACMDDRSEEHTSELQSLMRISYAVFCLKKKKIQQLKHNNNYQN